MYIIIAGPYNIAVDMLCLVVWIHATVQEKFCELVGICVFG